MPALRRRPLNPNVRCQTRANIINESSQSGSSLRDSSSARKCTFASKSILKRLKDEPIGRKRLRNRNVSRYCLAPAAAAQNQHEKTVRRVIGRDITRGQRALTKRQINLQKKKAFLERVKSQEPDLEKACEIRSSESDDVLVREKFSAVAQRTLRRDQREIASVHRIVHIGRGGFGEVSAWLVVKADGTRQRVAVKSFDPFEDGLTLARAEASVMAEFEEILDMPLLHWFVPFRPRGFPADFPAPAIIMPLFEDENYISPTLQTLVFEEWAIIPNCIWIAKITAQILEVLSKLHTAGWAHGDLHAGNIMIFKDEVILIDFSKASRKNRPYMYCLSKSPEWIQRLDWIEPIAVTGKNCCSRAGDLWSLGKLVQDLMEISDKLPLVPEDEPSRSKLLAFIHLTNHKRKFRPDAKFLIEVLTTNDLSKLNLCDCKDDCEMLQR